MVSWKKYPVGGKTFAGGAATPSPEAPRRRERWAARVRKKGNGREAGF